MFEDVTKNAGGLRAGPAVQGVIRAIAKRLLPAAPKGSIVFELPGGRRIRYGTPDATYGPEPVLVVHRYRALLKAVRRGSLGFAEAIIDGDLDSPDLVSVLLFYRRNQPRIEAKASSVFRVRGSDKKAHRRRENSKSNSRTNISEHYDLGNEFFRLWLDPSMLYSSALFPNDTSTLEASQMVKLDHILDEMAPEPGQHVLEIGCGWGALARRAAETRGVSVTGITLSHEQLAWARAETERAGLSDACTYKLEDYRDTDGTYDHIMSVEMIEAVGADYWPTYFETLNARLKPGGAAVLQAITIDEAAFPEYRASADFIQRYIFPGGMLPTKTIIREEATRVGLVPDTATCFGRSYARTLAEWRVRFVAAWPEIEALGFDERFRRTWMYYLDYCEAGFLDGIIDVGIYRLRKPG